MTPSEYSAHRFKLKIAKLFALNVGVGVLAGVLGTATLKSQYTNWYTALSEITTQNVIGSVTVGLIFVPVCCLYAKQAIQFQSELGSRILKANPLLGLLFLCATMTTFTSTNTLMGYPVRQTIFANSTCTMENSLKATLAGTAELLMLSGLGLGYMALVWMEMVSGPSVLLRYRDRLVEAVTPSYIIFRPDTR